MIRSKRELDRTTGAGWRSCVTVLTWLTFAWINPAFPADAPAVSFKLPPIATKLGGDIGYDIEQHSISGGSPTLRQRIIFNLRGQARTYISKPWIAQVLANLNFSSSKSKYLDSSSSNNSITGEAGLYLVPFSRYPFIASVSRSENFTGPGFGSLTDTTTRFGINQSYNPKGGRERYQLIYNKTNTEYESSGSFRDQEINFNAASTRFDHRTLTFDATRRRGKQPNTGKSILTDNTFIRDRYLPNSRFTMENNAIYRSSYENLPTDSVISRNRELNSTISFQGSKAPYSVLGALRANVYDFDYYSNPSHSRTLNANLGVNYRPIQYVTLYASGNVNVSDDYSQRTTRVSAYQAATTNYPLASFDLDAYHYSSRIGGTISNRINSISRSNNPGSRQYDNTQTVSVNPSHSLSRNIILGGGRMQLRLDQSLSATESTRSQTKARLVNSATADWRRAITTLRMTARDTRSLSSAQDSFQYFSLYGGLNEQINRDSSLTGYLQMDQTRQISKASPDSITFTNSSFGLYYRHQRAFGVPRLQFNSNLRASSQTPIPALVAPPDKQGPIGWENSLAYKVGRLTVDFKVSLTKEGKGSSQSLIWFSIKRYF